MVWSARRTAALMGAVLAAMPIYRAGAEQDGSRGSAELPTDPDPASVAASLSQIGAGRPSQPPPAMIAEPGPAPRDRTSAPVHTASPTIPSYKGTVRLALDPDGEGTVLFSHRDTNRIIVSNDRIKTVIVDEGRADVSSTEDGHVFVRFAPNASNTSFYVVTESLRTFKVVAMLADVPGVQLLVEPKDTTRAAARANDAVQGNIVSTAMTLIKGMVTGDDLLDYERPSGNTTVSIGPYQALVLAEFVGEDLIGRRLLVQPAPNRKLNEQGVAQSLPGTIAVMLTPTPGAEHPWVVYWVGRHV